MGVCPCREVLGKPQDIAELEVFYCESCGYFLESISLDDEYYCLALERMFERTINSTLLLSKKRQEKLFARLDWVFCHSENWDWDVRGGLETIIAENEKVHQFFNL